MKKIIVFLFLIITAISCGQNPNNNNDWRTTYKECPDCDGEGSVNERCYCCSGYGYVLQYCSECDGTGTSLTIIQTQEPITCPDCWGGDGSHVCKHFNGTGYVDCDTCRGKRYHTCYFCKGKGTAIIFGELMLCPRCSGCGDEICSMCDGSGKEACSKTTYCRTCFGQGTIGVRPVVREEYNVCECCDGNKTVMAKCSQCRGR